MGIFQKSVIQKHLGNLDKELVEKAFRKFRENYNPGKIEKISNRFDTFFSFDFKTFIVELKKQKIKLSLIQQDEWEEYFNAYKPEIYQLQYEIDKTDNEIDQMVYELYGLTEEEIKIAEESV